MKNAIPHIVELYDDHKLPVFVRGNLVVVLRVAAAIGL